MKARTIISIVLIIVGIVLMVVLLDGMTNSNRSVGYYELLEKIENGEIKNIYVNGLYRVRVLYTTDSQIRNESAFPGSYDAEIIIPSRERFFNDFNSMLEEYNEKRESDTNFAESEANKEALGSYVSIASLSLKLRPSDPTASSIWDYMIYGVMMLSVIVLVLLFFRQMSKQNNQGVQFARSKARVNESVKVRFSDVAGCEEEKEEMAEIIDFLKAPKKYTNVGARIPHGILLVGPPGTGKTLLAKAVAGEAGVPFFSISGSDFVEMYVGVGAARVRDLFEQAKHNLPCIVFIDEIDAVGRQRGAGLGGGHDEREQTLNQLLVQMDGFETNSGIIVMAATNRSDILDPALLRPGRFDRQIYVDYPDVRGREAIFRVHSRNKPLAPDVDFKAIARVTIGFTGADIENVLNEAAILAVRDGRKLICMDDINEGIYKLSMGPAKRSRLVTDNDKRITAYHEAGHAIVCKSCPNAPAVHEVTIVPRGQAAGFNSLRPDNDDRHVNKQHLMDQLAISLGGRVAEELVFPSITTGASADIRSASATAHKMITEWGMSELLGPVFYGSEGEVFVGKNYQTKTSYSEEFSAIIDRETQKLIKTAHERATKILKDKFNVLENMAKILIEVETIAGEDIDDIMAGEAPESVVAKVRRKQEAYTASHDKLRAEQANA